MLRTRQMIPPVTARAPDGRIVRAWDYKQKKNLAIAFLHANCASCEAFLADLRERAAALAEREAVALVIFSETPPAALSDNLPPQIVVAADVGGRSQRAFLGEDAFGPAGQERLGVFVTDRFGELYAQSVGRREAELPGVEEVSGWLGHIQLACEECGVSHWPTEG